MQKTNEQIAMRVSWNSIFANILLSAGKLAAGFYGHSAAMISDAIHSLSDILSTGVVIVGIKLAARESDENHQYGHERLECVAAIILSVMLLLTGAGIGLSGLKTVFGGDYSRLAIPGLSALIAAVVSIVVKEGMYWYTRSAAKKINSSVLMADAWHHRSDALSSIGSFAGILGARMGYPVLDSVAAILICAVVIKAAVEIFIGAVKKMTDRSCDEEMCGKIRALILAQSGVLSIDLLRTRLFSDRIFVDVEIASDGNATLYESHAIAQCVHDAIELEFPAVKHCMVHVNPAPTKKNVPRTT